MNLHGIVRQAIGAVNPTIYATLRVSAGYTIGPDLKQIPQDRTIPNVPIQMQALSGSDLRQLGSLNIQSVNRAIYLNGDIQGVNRSEIKGGDLFCCADGTEWLVTQTLETWPDWCKVAVVQQAPQQNGNTI